MPDPTPIPATDDIPVMLLAGTWIRHLHDADQVNLDHQAADVEYLPPSPVADLLRAAVDDERARRIVTAGLQVTA